MGLSLQVKSRNNRRHTGLHSEQKRGITEQIHMQKDSKEDAKPNSTVKRFTLDSSNTKMMACLTTIKMSKSKLTYKETIENVYS